MGMVLCLASVTDEQLDGFLKSPDSIESWLSRDGADEAYLDKAWHGIHYLLTGTDWHGEEPFCYLLDGGQNIGDIDVGYGPARGLSSGQASAFSKALTAFSEADLKARFNPAKMEQLDIYPSIWGEDDDAFAYLYGHFQTLTEFFQDVEMHQKGSLIWIC